METDKSEFINLYKLHSLHHRLSTDSSIKETWIVDGAVSTLFICSVQVASSGLLWASRTSIPQRWCKAAKLGWTCSFQLPSASQIIRIQDTVRIIQINVQMHMHTIQEALSWSPDADPQQKSDSACNCLKQKPAWTPSSAAETARDPSESPRIPMPDMLIKCWSNVTCCFSRQLVWVDTQPAASLAKPKAGSAAHCSAFGAWSFPFLKTCLKPFRTCRH